MTEFLRYYDHFVLPFAIGVIVLFCVIIYKYVRWFTRMPESDHELVRRGFFTSRTIKAVGETVCESLLHRKIWRVNPVLGYMHMSLALGWFLLIVVGWVESSMHFDAAIMPPYTHVFFKFFGPTSIETTTGRLLGFVMDALLLFVLSGVTLAWFKRLRSRALGMRRTTRHSLFDRLAMMSLWMVFPARLVAESATSGIDGGQTFLTGALGFRMLELLGIERLYLVNAGAWWFYSLVLGVFFVSMPFSRYMHIFTEVPLIFLRRWGVRAGAASSSGDNFQVEACSRCGICIDPCPMQSVLGVRDMQAAYYLRDRRYHKLTRNVAENCLMCGRCDARCPVGVEVSALRLGSRRMFNDVPAEGRYDYLPSVESGEWRVELGGRHCEGEARSNPEKANRNAGLLRFARNDETPLSTLHYPHSRVGYFAGCMTLLQPAILKAMEAVFEQVGEDVWWADRDGGVCCGRPLKLAGEVSAAQKMMRFNEELFRRAGITTLVTSCPICLRVFREDYKLEGIEILHHSEYIARELGGRHCEGEARSNPEKASQDAGLLRFARNDETPNSTLHSPPSTLHPSHFVYHDPCELGRGCGVYDAPREVLRRFGEVREPAQTRKDSPCCGASLGNVGLNDGDQQRIGRALAEQLETTGADCIVTACPLCKRQLTAYSSLPVKDIAEVVAGGS